MAAATVDIPAIVLSGGPMLNGWFRGERTGSGTICLLYTSPSPRDRQKSRMPSSA